MAISYSTTSGDRTLFQFTSGFNTGALTIGVRWSPRSFSSTNIAWGCDGNSGTLYLATNTSGRLQVFLDAGGSGSTDRLSSSGPILSSATTWYDIFVTFGGSSAGGILYWAPTDHSSSLQNQTFTLPSTNYGPGLVRVAQCQDPLGVFGTGYYRDFGVWSAVKTSTQIDTIRGALGYNSGDTAWTGSVYAFLPLAAASSRATNTPGSSWITGTVAPSDQTDPSLTSGGNTVTGTPTGPVPTSSATVQPTIAVSGTPTAPVATSSGSVQPNAKVTASPTAPAPTSTGAAGSVTPSVSGSPTAPVSAASGTVQPTVAITSTATGPVPTSSGSVGSTTPTASGSPTTPLPVSAGAVAPTVAVSAAATAPLPTSTGSVVPLTGPSVSGSPTLPAPSGAGAVAPMGVVQASALSPGPSMAALVQALARVTGSTSGPVPTSSGSVLQVQPEPLAEGVSCLLDSLLVTLELAPQPLTVELAQSNLHVELLS